jgi:hypothetical protein
MARTIHHHRGDPCIASETKRPDKTKATRGTPNNFGASMCCSSANRRVPKNDLLRGRDRIDFCVSCITRKWPILVRMKMGDSRTSCSIEPIRGTTWRKGTSVLCTYEKSQIKSSSRQKKPIRHLPISKSAFHTTNVGHTQWKRVVTTIHCSHAIGCKHDTSSLAHRGRKSSWSLAAGVFS